MTTDTPIVTPPAIDSIAAVGAIAAASPPDHHSVSIFERLWAFFAGTGAPVAASLIAANNPKLAGALTSTVAGVQAQPPV